MVDRSENARIGGKYRARHAWERSTGYERMRTANEALGTDAPLDKVYKARNWAGGPTPPTVRQGTWEALGEEERLHAERQLKAQTGGDIEFMSRAYGAAIDQRYLQPTKQAPASLATPYTEPPTRSSPQREPRGVMMRVALKQPEPHVAHPTADMVTTATKQTSELLPHTNEAEEEIAQRVPNFHAAADYARRKALQARGLT